MWGPTRLKSENGKRDEGRNGWRDSDEKEDRYGDLLTRLTRLIGLTADHFVF